MVNGGGKSDSLVVPGKPLNKVLGQAAEVVEGRGLAKGSLLEPDALRTQGRVGVPSALERVRRAALRDRRLRFTALLHHVYAIERLRVAYFALRREVAPGVDGKHGGDMGRIWSQISGDFLRGLGGGHLMESLCWRIRLSSVPSSRY